MRQVHQLKNAIQIHNDSIQFLKRQNAELKADLDDKKIKVSSEYFLKIHFLEFLKNNSMAAIKKRFKFFSLLKS